VTLIQ